MTWPPVKAWTSKISIHDQKYFVAINYGGEKIDRWVVLMSVLDSTVIVKVPWSQLNDQSVWGCGWNEDNCSTFSKSSNNKKDIINTTCKDLSIDSGLTVPITENFIRPWFKNIEA